MTHGRPTQALRSRPSKKAGYPNKLAKIGLIVGNVLTVLIVILYITVFAVAFSSGVTTQ